MVISKFSKELKSGRRVRRNSWAWDNGGIHWDRLQQEFIETNDILTKHGYPKGATFEFDLESILATDWELTED